MNPNSTDKEALARAVKLYRAQSPPAPSRLTKCSETIHGRRSQNSAPTRVRTAFCDCSLGGTRLASPASTI